MSDPRQGRLLEGDDELFRHPMWDGTVPDAITGSARPFAEAAIAKIKTLATPLDGRPNSDAYVDYLQTVYARVTAMAAYAPDDVPTRLIGKIHEDAAMFVRTINVAMERKPMPHAEKWAKSTIETIRRYAQELTDAITKEIR